MHVCPWCFSACSVVTGTLEQVADGNSLEHALNAITFTSLSKSPRSARITKVRSLRSLNCCNHYQKHCDYVLENFGTFYEIAACFCLLFLLTVSVIKQLHVYAIQKVFLNLIHALKVTRTVFGKALLK